MADILADIRPVTELLQTLQSEGVRADNRDRLRLQLAVLRSAIKQFSSEDRTPKSAHTDQQSPRALEVLQEQLRFAREARQFLEESIVAAETFVSMQLNADRSSAEEANGPRGYADGTLRARPVKGNIDHTELSREFMARFPKIRAALAK